MACDDGAIRARLLPRIPRMWPWLLALAALYVAICALLFVLQERLVFFPLRPLAVTPAAAGLAFEDVELRLPDGTRLHGWYVPREGARGTALWCHGNAGNISHRVTVLRMLAELGLASLIFDYPGYGRSDGSPGEQGCYDAADAAWRHLVEERHVPPERIVIWGRSLGSAVAIELASRRASAAVIVESGMTSIVDVARRQFFWLPVRLLCRHRFDAGARVATVRVPKLFVHSRDDEIVPWELGRRLFDLAPAPKRWVEIRGGHNEGQIVSGERYVEPVRAFLAEVLPDR